MDYGTSGSPVWDDAGRVVGLATSGGPDAPPGEGKMCIAAQTLPVWLAESMRSWQEAVPVLERGATKGE